MPLEAGCSDPGEALDTWQEARGDRFCFFHFDESLIPPALIFNCEYQTHTKKKCPIAIQFQTSNSILGG